MKKILITGNSGYIGSHLSKLLYNEYEVHGLDLVEPQAPVHHQYICDIRKPFELDIEFDAVIHLAALVNVGESEVRPIDYYITNLTGTMNIVNRIKTKNFILASTGAAENCLSTYGVSKRAAEDVIREFCNIRRPIPYTIFRFYNVVGTDGYDPTNIDGLMYNLLKATMTGRFTVFGNDYTESHDGTCVRDYVHVMEICHAIKEAILVPANNIECLGHGIGYTVNEIIDIYKRVNGFDFKVDYGPRRAGDLPCSVLKNKSTYMKSLYSIEQLLKVGI